MKYIVLVAAQILSWFLSYILYKNMDIISAFIGMIIIIISVIILFCNNIIKVNKSYNNVLKYDEFIKAELKKNKKI
jgi:hypothetical protein